MSSKVASSWVTPVIFSNLPKDFLLILLKLFSIALPHFVGTKPQVAVVVVMVVGTVVVVVEGKVVEVVEVDVVLVESTGGDPHPTRVAETTMLSKLPPIVVAAPPKLSTPKPIQSRLGGNCLPEGTFEPIFCGESHVTGFPET
jgi:hypothetical protein